MTIDEILAEWPGLEREDIYEALGYAAWAMEERIVPPWRGGGVRLLLSMNVLPQLGPRLATAGHACRHARDIGAAARRGPRDYCRSKGSWRSDRHTRSGLRTPARVLR
jgi:hypothetical protein